MGLSGCPAIVTNLPRPCCRVACQLASLSADAGRLMKLGVHPLWHAVLRGEGPYPIAHGVALFSKFYGQRFNSGGAGFTRFCLGRANASREGLCRASPSRR